MNISIGDKVKASKEYGGKSGVVTDIRGSFVVVEYTNGQSDSYHESDLIIKNKKMENGGVIGQEIIFDDNGEKNTGVIKEIHETTGNYIVLADDGRTVLADKELDVISLGKMRAKPAETKKRFGFFEDGGNLDSMTLNQLLDKVPVFERMHIDDYSNYARSKQAFDDLVKEFGDKRYSEEQSRQYDNFKKRKVMYENAYKQNVIKYLQSRKMEDGGNIEKETKEMLLSQIKEVKHHADELSQVVNKNTIIEPWVLAKATRAKTDLSDITHYLDSRKMARGGKLTDSQQAKFDKVMREWKAGTLHSGKNGPIVTDQDQALAIAYSQANSMMAFGGMIDDNLSEDSIDRMEGLSPTATLDEFVMNTQYIVKSLEEEGFEKDEILSFLAYTMVSTIKEAQSSSQTWTQQDQNALEGWISDIQDGYGWITPGYVETSWTSRPGSGTKEWTGDIQRRVYQALIDENMLFRANENDPEKKGRKVKDLTTAIWAASEEMSTGGKMSNGGAIIDKGLEQFKNDEIAEDKDASIHLASFSGKSIKAQSTDKTWDDGSPVTKYFSRNGFKTITPKGSHYILESENWWYFKIGKTWYAVKKDDYGTPPFEYSNGGKMAHGGMTEHGLKRGDTIVYNSGNEVMVVDKNKNQKLIDLDKGERYVKGGQMHGWKHKLKAGGAALAHKNPTLNDSCTITVDGNIKLQPSDSYKPVYENSVIMLRVYKSSDKDGAYDVQLFSTNEFWHEFDFKERRRRSKIYVDEIKSQVSSLLQKDGVKLKSLKMITGKASM